MSIWTGAFWSATAERALKTFAQTAASLLLLDEVPGLLNVDWAGVASVAGLAALLSVLLSIGGNAATQDGPSFTRAEVVSPPAIVPAAEPRREAQDYELGHPDNLQTPPVTRRDDAV